ncbi:MAG: TlpA disulfide reductase family protein [Bacteroidota bacterium]
MKIKKEVREWLILSGIICIIFLGGWQATIASKMQQLVLTTGIIQPKIAKVTKNASYAFRLETMEGEIVDFSNFKGDIIFLNFWASWCPPCLAEMPDIHDLYEKHHENVSFIMISLDKDRQKAKDYVSRKEYDFPVYFLASKLPRNYSVSSIPTTYLLDQEGKIIVEKQGMAKYDTKKFNNLLRDLAKSE